MWHVNFGNRHEYVPARHRPPEHRHIHGKSQKGIDILTGQSLGLYWNIIPLMRFAAAANQPDAAGIPDIKIFEFFGRYIF